MKTFLKRTMVLIILMVIVIFTGDIFNFPLWPVDFLRTKIPVELQMITIGQYQPALTSILKNQTASRVEIETLTDSRVLTVKPSENGMLRVVLPVGRFKIKAMVSGVHQHQFYCFVSQSNASAHNQESTALNPGPVIVQFERNMTVADIPVFPIQKLSRDAIELNLTALVCKGDISSAAALESQLEKQTVEDIHDLIDLSAEFITLPVTAYNSHLALLEHCRVIVKRYCPDQTNPLLEIGDDLIDIDSRIEAIRHSRNLVIESYAGLIKAFQDSQNLDAMLETWILYESNPDLNPESEDEKETIPEIIRPFYSVMPEIRESIISSMTESYVNATVLYNTGNLLESRAVLTRILRQLRNLALRETFPTMESDIQNYLNDIGSILSANEAMRGGRFQEAFELFQTVSNSNEIIIRRMEEAQRFIELQSVPSMERQPN